MAARFFSASDLIDLFSTRRTTAFSNVNVRLSPVWSSIRMRSLSATRRVTVIDPSLDTLLSSLQYKTLIEHVKKATPANGLTLPPPWRRKKRLAQYILDCSRQARQPLLPVKQVHYRVHRALSLVAFCPAATNRNYLWASHDIAESSGASNLHGRQT